MATRGGRGACDAPGSGRGKRGRCAGRVPGEAVKAWVVVRAGHQVTSLDELHSLSHERLTGYKVPKTIEFRTELPKTMVGKVLRRGLTRKRKVGLFERGNLGQRHRTLRARAWR